MPSFAALLTISIGTGYPLLELLPVLLDGQHAHPVLLQLLDQVHVELGQ